ncbi:MAG: AAA family ATPase [Bryocella sp.]
MSRRSRDGSVEFSDARKTLLCRPVNKMYKTFYRLSSNPFGISPDPRFLYLMPHTREALAALEFGISARRGFIVLTGEAGTGKTTLLRRTIEFFDPNLIVSSFVFNPRLDVLDFMEFILTDFGLTPTSHTKSGMLLQLNRWLIERFRAGQTCVIVIDEAQNLSMDMLEEIRLLTNLETSSDKLLQIVLSGQPELADLLTSPQLRQLRQRIALWCRTYSLTEEQTLDYVERRLVIAGALPEEQKDPETALFSREALIEVHRGSQGIPRLVNLICEHSLIFGYVDQLRQIPASIVRDVIQDLDLGAHHENPMLDTKSGGPTLHPAPPSNATASDDQPVIERESGKAR